MSVFVRYKEVEKKRNQILNVEWPILGGGFCLIGQDNWTISHRFAVKGSYLDGTEKEFIFRFQIALEREPRFSWMTLEVLNLFEARWFYFITKLWKQVHFKVAFCLGWRLSKLSREFLNRQIMEHERRTRVKMESVIQSVQNAGNGSQIKEVI